MKKKISVFALLLSFMFAFVVPVQAKAADEKYSNITEFLESYGYETFIENESAVYVARTYSSWLYVHEFTVMDDYPTLAKSSDGNAIYVFSLDGNNIPVNTYIYNSPTKAAESQSYSIVSTVSGKHTTTITDTSMQYKDVDISIWRLINFSYLTNLLYTDVNVYSCETYGVNSNAVIYYDEILVPSSKPDYYTFMDWCSDAELPNPSGHTFNANYYYLVTHNALGYFVTQVYADESINQFTELVSYGNKIYLHCKDAIDSTIFVNRFYYINGKWSTVRTEYFTLDYNKLLDLNVSISENNKLFYSNNAIRTGLTFESMYYLSDTDFSEGFSGQENPYLYPNNKDLMPDYSGLGDSGSSGSGSNDNESSDSGSSGSGSNDNVSSGSGSVSGGGGLDFIISLFTKIWTDICSVKMSVDGYSISLQQIFVYGALVSIVGGFIMHFIFGRK